MKKILIILAHPLKDSFCGALANAYESGAREAGHEVRRVNLGDLSFDPLLRHGYKQIQALEPDLLSAQDDIVWCQHLVIVWPTWWGTYPALLKGFFDRAILPGFGFKYRRDSMLWERLLKGRSARLITTMDGPRFFYSFFLFSAGLRAVKSAVLQYCGIWPVRSTVISRLRSKAEPERRATLEKIKRLGDRAF